MRPAKTAFAEALLRRRPILLDGGLATQLEAQGCDINNVLWSASILRSDPQAIVKASRAYLDAGAECIATASYQASCEGFNAAGIGSDDADALMLLSVTLAATARADYLQDNPDTGRTVLLAASLGPFGAMLHDGSEYTGDYDASTETLRDFHAARLSLFDQSDADVLALETIPSAPEAAVLADLLADCRTPSWVSFCCRDNERISDGTPLVEVVRLFENHPSVLAVGVNCTPPQYMTALVRRVRDALPDKAIAAYPNSGETFEVAAGGWTGAPNCDTSAVSQWIAAGARLVGGCCRVGPAQIRAMAALLEEYDV